MATMMEGSRDGRRRGVGLTVAALVLAVALVAALASVGGSVPARAATSQQLPGIGEDIPAPDTSLSDDGRTATDGVRTLTVSQVTDLDPAGQAVTVTGSGYDDFKGIYVAMCVVPPTDQPPTPCGGGIDMEGTSGSSYWVSSNPPPYGEGLAVPYGPDGSFEAAINVSAEIGDTVDCRRVSCAIVTRNDHVRTTDRSQDIFVPLTFAAEPGSSPAATEVPISEATTTTTEATTTTTEAAATTSDEPADDADLAAADASGDGGGSATPWIVVGVVVVLAAVAAGVVVVRRRGATS